MQNLKVTYPEYFKKFKCIGGACEDSCCIGWDIDIDKISFRKYFRTNNVEMKRIFQKNLRNNDDYISENIDYGKVKLAKNKRCPFLDDTNLCIIYTNMGEESLSNVCTFFPRVLNKVDENYEISLDVACPEAARLVLMKKDTIKFEEHEESFTKYIVSRDINTKDRKFDDTAVRYLKEIREYSTKILQNREYDLDRRMYMLGQFINDVDDEIRNNYNNVKNYIRNYDVSSIDMMFDNDGINYILQVDFFKRMINMLHVETDVESESFKEYTRKAVDSLHLNEDDCIQKYSMMYVEKFKKYEMNFMKKYSYIFENYLVNFIYNNLFPFSETEFIFDGYIMLLKRYSFIRFYLVGLYLYNDEKQTEDEIVKFIQSFSKTIEHHKTYLVDSLAYIKMKEFNNMQFAATLI